MDGKQLQKLKMMHLSYYRFTSRGNGPRSQSVLTRERTLDLAGGVLKHALREWVLLLGCSVGPSLTMNRSPNLHKACAIAC
jgi:hypothetical protein